MPKPRPESFVGYRCKFREMWEADVTAARTVQYGVYELTTPDGIKRVQPDHAGEIVRLHPLPDALVPPVEKPTPEPKATPPTGVKRAIERGTDGVREVVRQASADILTADSVIPPGVESLLTGPTSAVGIQEDPADLPPCVSAPDGSLYLALTVTKMPDDEVSEPKGWLECRLTLPNTPEARAIVRRALMAGLD